MEYNQKKHFPLIKEMHEKGLTQSEIAAELTKQGIKTATGVDISQSYISKYMIRGGMRQMVKKKIRRTPRTTGTNWTTVAEPPPLTTVGAIKLIVNKTYTERQMEQIVEMLMK